MITAPLPDAGQNWVDRHAPERLKPWLKLGRFDRPIGIWLLLLPGWQGIALLLAQRPGSVGIYDLWLFVAFAIGACLMRAAGCAFNDIVDRDFDARVARTALRPIPAGLITVKQAWAFLLACSLISLSILLTFNQLAVMVGALSLGLVAAYPFMKRITWWPQAWLGLTFNWGVLLGYAAAGGVATGFALSTGAGWLPALMLYAGGLFWTLGYDTIYALQDIEDDAMVGVKSSARRLGQGARRGVAAFYVLAFILPLAAGWTAGLGPLFFAGITAYGLHLGWQVQALKRLDDSPLALRIFKSNRQAGLILLAAIGLGALGL